MLALAFVIVAYVATLIARAHPSNTPRTRAWWARFLVLLTLLLIAQLTTNVEEFLREDAPATRVINLIEHGAVATSALCAFSIAIRGLIEARQRESNIEGIQQ